MPCQTVPRWNARQELEFTKLEYHLELEFSELEYQKSGRLLMSSETMLNCYKFCKMMVFGHFLRKNCVLLQLKIHFACVTYSVIFTYQNTGLKDKEFCSNEVSCCRQTRQYLKDRFQFNIYSTTIPSFLCNQILLRFYHLKKKFIMTFI